MAKTKVGIVGLGYVGGALRHWFELAPEKYDLYFYDKYKEVGSPEEVNKAGIIFVAVPTPYYDKKSACHEVHPVRSRARGLAASPNRTAGVTTSNGVHPAPAANVAGYDDSAVRDVLENTIKDGKVVVIKSSVLPGSTDKFQKEHPKKTLLFNPEFLTANNAVEDFLHPHRRGVHR